MDSNSDWLPPLILMQDYQNDWDQYLEAIYQCFYQDFVASKPYFEDRRFGLKRHPILKGKEATFWHIISEGEVESERVPDLRRCERIRILYLWLRVGLLKREFQAQFSVTKSRTLREGYSTRY